MTNQRVTVCERLKLLGYAQSKQVRMYGEEFELVSDPITIGEHLVVVDALERKSGSLRRVRIPLPIVNRIRQELRVA